MSLAYISESLWREGLNMDSSIFSDDDFLDWRWPASIPRRCDRECADGMRRILGTDYSTLGNYAAPPSSCSCSSSSSSSSNSEDIFFYCTEELGSESTSGVGDLCVTPFSYNFSINEKRPSSSSSSSSSSVLASTSGRCAYDDFNCAFTQQACSTSTCLNASSTHSLDLQDPSSSPINISSHGPPFDANAPYHHHCHVVSRGANRAFPPPIASLLSDRPLMRSFKSNGRFILKKVSNVSRSLFRSTRENGHLRLDLLSCSCDCLESQYAFLFPASSSMSIALQDVPVESISTSDLRHYHDCDRDQDLHTESMPSLYHWLRSPSPHSMRQKPTLNYETLSPPSKLQAFVMLMHPKGLCSPLVEESISTSCTSFQAERLITGQKGGNAATAQSTPHVVALLRLLPIGLGLIIFEICWKVKGGDHVTLYGMYIPKTLDFKVVGQP